MVLDAPVIESGVGSFNFVGFGATRRHEFVSHNSNIYDNNMKLFKFNVILTRKDVTLLANYPFYAYQRVKQVCKQFGKKYI